MSDNRYKQGVWQGNPITRRSPLTSPLDCGWQKAGYNDLGYALFTLPAYPQILMRMVDPCDPAEVQDKDAVVFYDRLPWLALAGTFEEITAAVVAELTGELTIKEITR